MLSDAHRELLLASAITPDVIASSGIESTPTGIRFPWNDGGDDVWQLRPDEPKLDDKGEPVKYLFPKGATIPLNHLRVTGADAVLIVEGTKQSYAALSYAPPHMDVVGMSGCWGWKNADLSLFFGKRVYVAVDADMAENLGVWKSAGQLKQALEDEGAAEVLYVRTNGKGKEGLDDVLARTPENRRGDMLKVWLTNASPKRPARPKAKASKARTEAAGRFAAGTGFDAVQAAEMGADFALSDQLVAERVAAELMDGFLCFSPELGWMRWNGKVWVRVDESVAVAETGEYLKRFVAAETANPTIPVAPKERATLLSRTRINAVVSLCKGLTGTEGDAFDRHPDLLSCENGVIDLRSGKLLDFDHTRLMTTFVPTAYVPGAIHPDVDAALTSMDPAVRDWTRVRFGQGITGHTPDDDVTPLLHGQGSNGKSVLITGATATLGTGKSGAMRQVADAVLVGDRDAKEEKMALRGARIVYIEELPEGAHLNINHLKKIVGTPTITSRHLYRSEVTWEASHSLFITTNYLPQVVETDHGTWRRLARIPFPYKYVPGTPEGANERQGDPGLRSRMKDREQREALLAWMVSGAVDWYAAGRRMAAAPLEVIASTEAWRGESDMVVRFWSENLVADPEAHIPVNELSEALNEFLTSNDKSKWGSNVIASRFGGHDQLQRHGVEKRQTKRTEGRSRRAGSTQPNPAKVTAWFGIRFRDERDDAPVADPIAPSGVEMPEDDPFVPRLNPTGVPVAASEALSVPDTDDAEIEPQTAAQGFSLTASALPELPAGNGDPFADGLGLDFRF